MKTFFSVAMAAVANLAMLLSLSCTLVTHVDEYEVKEGTTDGTAGSGTRPAPASCLRNLEGIVADNECRDCVCQNCQAEVAECIKTNGCREIYICAIRASCTDAVCVTLECGPVLGAFPYAVGPANNAANCLANCRSACW